MRPVSPQSTSLKQGKNGVFHINPVIYACLRSMRGIIIVINQITIAFAAAKKKKGCSDESYSNRKNFDFFHMIRFWGCNMISGKIIQHQGQKETRC